MNMHDQRQDYDRASHLILEPGPGSLAVGYVRSRPDLKDAITLADQKRLIAEFAAEKGWQLVKWYEEPEQSAMYEVTEQRPSFAQVLSDASGQFQVVLCAASRYWSRHIASAYASFKLLRQLGVWWATADGRWDSNTVWQKDSDVVCVLRRSPAAKHRRRGSRPLQRGGK